jgi:hypothetical protein
MMNNPFPLDPNPKPKPFNPPEEWDEWEEE